MSSPLDGFLGNYLDDPNPLSKHLLESIQGGKRVRPRLVLSLCKNTTQEVLPAAAAIEIIHCMSLILDDITDKDTHRRNKQCFHIRHGESQAMLVVLYGLSVSLDLFLLSAKSLENSLQTKLLSYVSEKTRHLSLGQYLDTHAEDFQASDILNIMQKKTGSLFSLCFAVVLLFEKKTQDLSLAEDLGNYLGIMYQIADDFVDEEQDSLKNGSVHNYVLDKGRDVAKQKFFTTRDFFSNLAKQEDMYNQNLEDMLQLLTDRINL